MKETVNILMIDDDEEDFMIIRDLLSEIKGKTFGLEWISNAEDGLACIRNKKHDVIFVDYRLGPTIGLDLIRSAIRSGCDEPLILLTGQNDPEIDRQALEAGAADYLVKGNFTAQQLERCMRYSIQQARSLREIKALNMDLEKRVKERTMVLEEALQELGNSREELSKALEREKELNELKTRFVAMASHEFRTPLATILSSLSLVSKYGEQNDKEKQAKHFGRIKAAITHLTDILNDVLSISKLEEGKTPVNPEPINIQEFTQEVVQEMQAIARNGQKIDYKHTGDNSTLLDKKIYRHILLNLLSNAIKFSPEGKTVYLRTSNEKDIFVLEVKDEGMGISQDDQKHLFERFFRGHNAINIQGTGLGLNIIAKYVELMGGTIAVDSVLEEGTRFTVHLPHNQLHEITNN